MRKSLLALKIGAGLVFLLLTICFSASAIITYNMGFATNVFNPAELPRAAYDTELITSFWKNKANLNAYTLSNKQCLLNPILSCLNNQFPLVSNVDDSSCIMKYWNHFGHGNPEWIDSIFSVWLQLWLSPHIYPDALKNKAGIGSADIVFVASCFSFAEKNGGRASPIKTVIINQHPKYYIGYKSKVSIINNDGSSQAWDTPRDFWFNYLYKSYPSNPVAYALKEAAEDNNLDLQYVGLWMEGVGDIDLSALPPLPDLGMSLESKY